MPLNIASASLTLSLPANALVRTLTVEVRADAAGSMKLSDVGQVRIQTSQQAGNANGTSAVIDFGTPLTISGASAPSSSSTLIRAIYRWRGDSFDIANPVFTNTGGASSATFAEVSVSRLQLELTPAATQAQAEAMLVLLPALPTDLEVHVNDGPVVWRYPGPRGAPGVDGWMTVVDQGVTYTQKEVDLTDVVAPMLGNPTSSAAVTVTIELRARIPGRLRVVSGTVDYDLLETVPVLPEPNLAFDGEGDQNVSLAVPSGANTTLKEVWVTLAASPPKERAVPAVGPSRINQVALVLDSGRSAAVRFPEDQLGELTALRLPLTAQDGTAEVRAQLLSPVGTVPNDEPGQALEGASATQPVQLEPPPSSPRGLLQEPAPNPDTWVLLPFDKPVSFKGPVWVQLQVTRGTVLWSLGSFSETEDLPPFPVRRGSPTGPWLPLPAAVTAISGMGGRLHAIGHAPKASPMAPVQLQISSTTPSFSSEKTDVTPTAKGVAVKLVLQQSDVMAQQSWLRVISRAATTVTVQSLIRVVAKP